MWVAKGSEGDGRAWQILGLAWLALAAFMFLKMQVERRGVLALSIAFVAIVGAMRVGAFARSLAPALPEPLQPFFESLGREPGSLVLAAAIGFSAALWLAFSCAPARTETKSADAGLPPQTWWSAFEPAAVMAVTAAKATAWFGLLLLVPAWLQGPQGPCTRWIEPRSGRILAIAVIVSVLAIPAIHVFRGLLWVDGERPPKLSDATWMVFWALTAFGFLLLLTVLLLTFAAL